MPPSNNTCIQSHSPEFVLLCFPGDWTWWKCLLSALLLIMFIVATATNLTLMMIIQIERSLHTPMYYFIGLLSFVDLVVCFVVVPPFLNYLWSSSKTISALSCFIQIYLICTSISVLSAVFILMSYDRYIAICNPLKYPIIISNHYMLKAAMVSVGRSTILNIPMVVLTALHNYCGKNVLLQCYCENLSVASLARDKSPVDRIYTATIIWFSTGFDVAFITFSYFMILRAVLKLRSRGAMTKAFSTCASHLILTVYFYSSELALVIANILATGHMPNDVRTLVSILFCLIPPVLNPLVFGLKTKEIRERLILKYRKVKWVQSQLSFC